MIKKTLKLQGIIESYGAVIVCFSGGVDSGLLAFLARKYLGDQMIALTADSPSLSRHDLARATAFCTHHDIPHQIKQTNELDDTAYIKNDLNRCYHCKKHLLITADRLKSMFDTATQTHMFQSTPAILLGTTVSDLSEHRPGHQAAQDWGAKHPLVEAEFSKQDVRTLAEFHDLSLWDEPEMACLSSRIAHSIHVTKRALSQVEAVEMGLRQLGFSALRARHHGDTLRIEAQPEDIARLATAAIRDQITSTAKAHGYRFVTLDLEGYRRGSLQNKLPPTVAFSRKRSKI